ncbi:MAG: hypothetical protein IBJ11_11780 [Phycisphaerales bacterium]|nr:hypothetical protein [Phycisphaerales bacterium]
MPNDWIYNLWVRPVGGSWINGPTDSRAAINIPLTPGTYAYEMWGEPGQWMTHYGMNLFFNDDVVTPRISTWAARNESATGPRPDFFANSNSATRYLDGQWKRGAGTLVFDDLSTNLRITLTQYWFGAPLPQSFDQVGAFDVSRSNVSDYMGQINLSVTPIPAPGAAGLLAAAGAIALRRRRSS